MTRYSAFATHLIVSATIVGAIVALTMLVWYPEPYLYLNSADRILLLLIAVDVIIGPTLTLIVFKPGKPGLKMDMAIIFAVQLAALIYGSFTLYRERPLFLVFAVDRFELVTASEIDMRKLKYPELRDLPLAGPGLAVALKPRDRKERQKIMMAVLLHGAPDIERRPELYEPYQEHKDRVLKKSVSLEKIIRTDTGRARLSAFLAQHGAGREDFAYLPLLGKDQDREMIIAIDRETGQPVGGIRINPWGDESKPGH